jgi:mannosyltransferase OCH1-like enzyme
MIPKTIHYVWLSDDVVPSELKTCMDSWQKIMAGYKIKCWNKRNFDINSIAFVSEACKEKKWALACDYIGLTQINNFRSGYFDK